MADRYGSNMPTVPLLQDVVEFIDRRYPREWAESWDAVGLVCGRLDAHVEKVLFAVDPLPDVVAEAISWGAHLLVTHHPLFLLPVHDVSSTSWKGRVVHDLVEERVGLMCVHTNADVAAGGVNDALAAQLGLTHIAIMEPSLHPEAVASGAGLGRFGTLQQPMPLSEFVDIVASRLPDTNSGIKVAGDADKPVQRVGVCGGAGDSLLQRAIDLQLDVFVTADLRHHATAEARARRLPAIVDPGHWASEWPWLPSAATRLAEDVAEGGATVEVAVSNLVTDPWSFHRPGTDRASAASK